MEEQPMVKVKVENLEVKDANKMDGNKHKINLPEERTVKKERKKTKTDVVDEITDVKKIIKDLQSELNKIELTISNINKKIPDNMEQKKFAELNERYSTEFQAKVAELEKEKSAVIADLNTSHEKAMEAKVAELEKEKSAAIADLNTSHEKEMEAKVAELEKEKSAAIAVLNTSHEKEMEAKVAELEKEKSAAIADLNTSHEKAMEAKVAELEKEKSAAIADLNTSHEKAMEAKVAELEKEKSAAIADLNTSHEKAMEAKVAELEKEKSAAIADLNTSHEKAMEAKVAELTRVTKGKQEADTKIKRWERASAPYVEVQKALNACPSVIDFLEKKNICGQGIDKLISLIMTLGKDMIFVSELHKFMTDEKKKSKEEMTVEEANMYYYLNQCFKQTCDIQHDLFVMPGNQNVKEQFNKVPFDKAQVENMNDPKNKNLRFTTSVYVPCLMTLENGRLYLQAQVKAGNS